MPYSVERRRRTPVQQLAAWLIVGVRALMLVALWLLFGELRTIEQVQHDNRGVGYGNRAATCQDLVANGVDVRTVPACTEPHVAALYDEHAAVTAGTKSDHERTQRMLCTIAAGAKIQVPECGG